MKIKKKIFFITTLLFLQCQSVLADDSKPKLILQITIDQLRGDLPDKFMKNMGDGGFRYLKKNGIWYANAYYGHSNTETVVGHTTLATGADPAEHGMISNVWFDRQENRNYYNIEDSRYPLLSAGADVDKDTEVDASQKLASTDGRSPANIIVSTFSDELAIYTHGKAKIFAVSVKDRGAVPLAGHAGKAFWFSKSKGEFISSQYYYKKYPAWVNEWNQKKNNLVYANKSWTLLHKQSTYLYANDDDKSWEKDIVGFGRTFPHVYGAAGNKQFNNYITFSPAGDELTLSFAKKIIEAEDLGNNSVPDYLSISFSSTDYVGHVFGPSSLEAEDNMLRLDRTLANLFSYIDQRVGLENTLIVLSADHGAPEAVGYMKSLGIDAGHVSPDKLDKKLALKSLKKRFGVGKELIKPFFPPYIYLDHDVIKKYKLDLAEVEQAVVEELMKIKGVALAVSSSALQSNKLPDTYLNRAALRNFNKKRSGDILVFLKPHYFMNDYHGEVLAANHGGPWKYDTYVPVVFAGVNIEGEKINRLVDPKDIAPTLSAILDLKSPSGSTGVPLVEVLSSINDD